MKKFISKYSLDIIIITLFLFTTMITFIGISKNSFSIFFSLLFIILLFTVIKLFHITFKSIANNKYILPFLLIICFVVKLVFVYLVPADPVDDYLTFFNFASEISQHTDPLTNFLYISVYPHVFGYAEFLGYIFSIFGISLTVGVFANVVMSCISLFFLYKICEKESGLTMAFICSVLWIVFPSQTCWNTILLSEPLYTMELFIIIYIMIQLTQASNNNFSFKIILLCCLLGVMISFFNYSRPVGIILIISYFIYLVFINAPSFSKRMGLILFITIFSFFGSSKLLTQHINNSINVPSDSFNWYSVATGFNENTNGQWNADDFYRLLDNLNNYYISGSSDPASDAQMIEKKIALSRISKIEHPLALLYSKTETLLGDDHTVIQHLSASNVDFRIISEKTAEKICDIFYYIIILLTFPCLYLYTRQEKSNYLCLPILYAIGLSLAQMLVEVNGRYHYSILVCFIFCSGYTINEFVRKSQENYESESAEPQA